MLTIFLCITACSRGERIKEISDVEPGDFKQYAGTYVGNNSDVVAIVNRLPGGPNAHAGTYYVQTDNGKGLNVRDNPDGRVGTNRIVVEPGRICVSEANCPDGICISQGWLSDQDVPIVCLPHRLIIKIKK